MCTATYLPLSGGFILTHSRDERTARPSAEPPEAYLHKQHLVVYPKDPQGGGTWIAGSAHRTVCLLNGAFVAHRPEPPYRHSRGLVPLRFFEQNDIDTFLRQFDADGLEPFTLLMLEGGRLTELRWNGRQTFVQEKDPGQAHIWSSVTLYTPEVVRRRENWFQDWQRQTPQPTVEAIRQFHLQGGAGDARNAIRMNRDNALMTLSLTSIVHQSGAVRLIYDDFIHPFSSQQLIPLSSHAVL